MKHATYILIMLMFCSLQTFAQKDSIIIRATEIRFKPDTFFLKMVEDGKMKDTFFINQGIDMKSKDSFVIRGFGEMSLLNDSLFRLRGKDSVLLYGTYTRYRADSLQTRKFKKQTELFVKQEREFKRSDSLFRKSEKGFARMDSLNRLNGRLYESKQGVYKKQQKSLDSLGRLKWRSDSTKIKEKLIKLRSDLQRIKEDSLVRNNQLSKREVSMEVSCNKNGNVVIRNLARKITVKTFNENKVRLVTVIRAEAGVETKDIDWADVLNVDIERNKNEVIIGPANTGSVTVTGSSNGSGKMVVSYAQNASASGGEVVKSRKYGGDKKSELVIYIPAKAKLTVENKYNNVAILNNLASLDIDLTNGNLKMEDADIAVIKSRYGSVKSGDLKNADIKLVNSKMSSGDIDKLVIDSKYSTVTFQNSGVIEMKSVSDEYSIAQAGTIVVNKNFGKFNIIQLNKSLAFTGTSADLKVNAINASVTEIKINNKYADIKLPVTLLTNYTLQFDGNYSKVFTPFQTVPDGADSLKRANVNFTKTVGNVNKNFTAVDISCASCSVDFR